MYIAMWLIIGFWFRLLAEITINSKKVRLNYFSVSLILQDFNGLTVGDVSICLHHMMHLTSYHMPINLRLQLYCIKDDES